MVHFRSKRPLVTQSALDGLQIKMEGLWTVKVVTEQTSVTRGHKRGRQLIINQTASHDVLKHAFCPAFNKTLSRGFYVVLDVLIKESG